MLVLNKLTKAMVVKLQNNCSWKYLLEEMAQECTEIKISITELFKQTNKPPSLLRQLKLQMSSNDYRCNLQAEVFYRRNQTILHQFQYDIQHVTIQCYEIKVKKNLLI